jgi:capsular polysaccharide export protein
MIFATSKPIAFIPNIHVLLNDEVTTKLSKNASHVAGWGAKNSGIKALILSKKHGLNALYLEDGFLRSYGTGDSFPPVSLVVDNVGIYYNSTQPSLLENMLNNNALIAQLLSEHLHKVLRAKDLIINNKLSKYNHAPLLSSLPLPKGLDVNHQRKKVLIIDQTAGDKSVLLGGAGVDTFQLMLKTAYAENPDAVFYIKTHPEVSSGKKKGYLTHVQNTENTVVLRELINPLSLIECVDHVYVVSSAMGFEALLLKKQVSVFGIPWYAGWGVTIDHQACPRRVQKRSVDELFVAAYFKYTRYINPVDKKIGTIFDAIHWLIMQKNALNAIVKRLA